MLAQMEDAKAAAAALFKAGRLAAALDAYGACFVSQREVEGRLLLDVVLRQDGRALSEGDSRFQSLREGDSPLDSFRQST